jgi:hypothetical protein
MSATHVGAPASDDTLAAILADLQALADMPCVDIPRPMFRCVKCGGVIRCPPEETLRYYRTGWPVCCRRVMGLVRPARYGATCE